jgi:hypothetical protein
MNARTIVTHFSKAAILAILLNVLWVAAVAAPISWLWNHVVVPLGRLPVISYKQALGFIMLWLLLKASTAGFQLSAKLSESE